MQAIGAAQDQQPAGQQGMQALAEEVKALGKQLMRVAQLAPVVHKPIMAYVEKMAEIGKAMQDTLGKAMQDGQQGAAPVETSTDGRNPSESPAAGAAGQA